MNPYIEVKDRSINSRLNYNDPDYNESEISLFHVFIAHDRLKVLFTIEWKDPNSNPREFQVVRHDHLYLDGSDRNTAYPTSNPPYVGQLSADPTIVQEMFSKNLDEYGIKLNKVTMHSMEFFESIDFQFIDPIKLEELYNLINETCIRVKQTTSLI